jgi:hypothetical protein
MEGQKRGKNGLKTALKPALNEENWVEFRGKTADFRGICFAHVSPSIICMWHIPSVFSPTQRRETSTLWCFLVFLN